MTGQPTIPDPSPDNGAEILRLALPLMTRHGIPATPQNYATWFHYASGDKPALKEHIDQLLEKQSTFTAELNKQLFEQFVSDCNLNQVEQIRQELHTTLQDTTDTLSTTGSDAQHYGEILEKFNASCNQAESISDIYSLMADVLNETRQMKDAADKIQQDFATKSAEMKELRKELEQVREKASTDALTGLTNRASFFEALEKAIEESTGGQPSPFCLAMLDIDHFKRVNDTFGHLVGDKVIRFVATTLQQSCKGQDTAGRYGGEEFALLLPDTGLEGGVTLCNTIRQRIADTNLVRTGSREPLGQVTISSGIAQYRAGEEMMDFVQRADQALYHSKKNGRNQVTAAKS